VQKRTVNLMVGFFLILGMVGLLVLAIQVSGLTVKRGNDYYTVVADFDNIGSLKVRQPVRIAGVSIGAVSGIVLDEKRYTAKVYLSIQKAYQLPFDTEASIMTEGVLGSKYISLSPGFEDSVLTDGDAIQETHSALILEDAIGKFLFNADTDKDKNN
jgi:phospholipid/cholesterol/gamma-HCH transport system substrate-binding protein